MKPYTGSIESETLKNTNYREAVFTGKHAQLVLMSLVPGEEIGNEVHPATDQFFRIEEGEATFIFEGKEKHQCRAGDAVVVPAGTHHNVVNSSSTKALKLYTIYSPPNHPAGTIEKTKLEPAVATHR